MIAYSSRTGNVAHVVKKLGLPNTKIEKGTVLTEPFLLFTYTDKLGAVPELVDEFMQINHELCKGVIGSGSINFGHANFCGAADKISAKYNIPIVRKIDTHGSDVDREDIKKFYEVHI